MGLGMRSWHHPGCTCIAGSHCFECSSSSRLSCAFMLHKAQYHCNLHLIGSLSSLGVLPWAAPTRAPDTAPPVPPCPTLTAEPAPAAPRHARREVASGTHYAGGQPLRFRLCFQTGTSSGLCPYIQKLHDRRCAQALTTAHAVVHARRSLYPFGPLRKTRKDLRALSQKHA